MNKADLRIELGRLRHERHAIDHELQRLESQLSALKIRKNLNGHQIRAIEKQLAHLNGDSVCLPRSEGKDRDVVTVLPQESVMASATSSVDIWFLAAVSLLVSAVALWNWFL
ncbi:hypothetical protein C7271_04420 [filamentous cyanobacterium CCP5]|nr:hypothetical protein C7271_04420 [filamentous cyanobacterium CCP5]